MVGGAPRPRERRGLKEWGWFLVWAAVGALATLATIIFFILAVLPSLLMIGLTWSVRATRRSVLGLLAGAGVPLLYIAYIHREGPGETCVRTATRVHCEDHLDPLPWLVLGVVLLLAGVVGQVWWGRRQIA